jgi:hypothetical protein
MPKEEGSIYSSDTINNGASCKNGKKPYLKCTMTSLPTVTWECGEGFNGCCFCRFDLGCNGQVPRGLRFDPFSCLQFLHWKKNWFAQLVCNVWPIHIHANSYGSQEGRYIGSEVHAKITKPVNLWSQDRRTSAPCGSLRRTSDLVAASHFALIWV